MALLIFEQGGLNNEQPVRVGRFVAKQSVAIGASSAQSAAFSAGVSLITVAASAPCHVEIGANPTATTGSFPLAADEKADFIVIAGDKLAVIQA